MQRTNTEIAESIRALAKARGVTIKQTLADCKINRNFIYDLEHGGSSPSVDKITRIADYFGVTVEELMSDTPSAGIKKDPIPKDGAEDSETAELREIWSSADENERRDLLEMARMLKNRRKQNG